MEEKKDRSRQEHLAVCVFDDNKGKLGQRVQDVIDGIMHGTVRNINYSAEQYAERHPIKTIRYVFDVVTEDRDLDDVFAIVLDKFLKSRLKGYIYMADSKYSNAHVVTILAFFNNGVMA